MKSICNRRDLLAAGAAACLLARSQAQAAPFKTALRKAVILPKVTAEALQRIKEAGFDGVEAGVAPVEEARRGRELADKAGLRIHSVLLGWVSFNAPDAAKAAGATAAIEGAVKAAAAFGADAVLFVPARIGGMTMPKPWEFRIRFDPRDAHLTRLTEGDDAPYRAYIDAHDFATDASRKGIERLIPFARESKVVLAVENVWNNLWVKPDLFASFVASFQSPWVKAYLDLGNHVKYAPAEEWVKTLAALLAKCHVKDFKLNPDGHDGRFVNIRDGSISWPAVRQALEEVGYGGWMTLEGGDLTLAEAARRMDLILAGK